jgi:hypothetical protein
MTTLAGRPLQERGGHPPNPSVEAWARWETEKAWLTQMLPSAPSAST